MYNIVFPKNMSVDYDLCETQINYIALKHVWSWKNKRSATLE